jgi:uncharacterized protein (DUF849 family)
MMDPLIITVAPNGARRGKADHPAIPLTPAEIGIEAARCKEAGAAMIHLHVRDAEGRHSLDPDLYRAAIAAVQQEAGPDLIVQVTTEAVGIFTPDQQIAAMQALQPEAFSVAVRELIPDEEAETVAAQFLKEQAERGVFIQHILYDENDVRRFGDLIDREVIPRTGASGLFVLGRYTQGQQSSPNDLLPFLNAWALDCLGPYVRSDGVKQLARLQLPAWAAMFVLDLKTTFTCRTGRWRPTMRLWSAALRMWPDH